MNRFELAIVEAILSSNIEDPEVLAMIAVHGIQGQRQKVHEKMFKVVLKNYHNKGIEKQPLSLKEFIELAYLFSKDAQIHAEDFIRLLEEFQLEYIVKESEIGHELLFDPHGSLDRICYLIDGCSINDDGVPFLNEFLAQLNKGTAISFLLHLIQGVPNGIKIDKSLRISNIHKLEISKLGLTYIPFLEKLYNLECLDCSQNEIYELNLLSNKKLVFLDCAENHLLNLDLRESKRLEMLVCDENKLTHLNVQNNPNLRHLSCADNQISELDLSENKELISLVCYCNEITSLNINCNPLIEFLDCAYNHIEELNVTKNVNLEHLIVQGNLLHSLNICSNKLLTSLNIIENDISGMDTSQNSLLTDIKKS